MRIFVGTHREEVVTLGRHAPEDQLIDRETLVTRGVLVRRVERGGGATAHGPGQVVVYPVIRLTDCGLDVPSLTRALLAAAQDAAAELGVDAEVTLGDAHRSAGLYVGRRKLASVGLRVKDGVVTHGLALNAGNALDLFGLIAPCGRRGLAACSLGSLGVAPVDVARLIDRLAFLVARRCVVAFTPESAQ